jgi:ABC-type transport system substrate-binding protein
MQVGILPKHLLQGTADINTDEFNSSRPVGTGPYMFKQWRRGENLTLVANPTHWRGKPKIDQWIRRVVLNDNLRDQQLKTGEIDYSPIAPTSIADLTAEQHLRFVSVSSPTSIIYIAYNLDRPLFQDKRVRQALSHGVDRHGILDSVLFGEGDLVDSPIPFQSWARSDSVPSFRFDLEKARKLLTEAGWTAGPDGILQQNGSRFAFSLSIQAGDPRRLGVATIVHDAWRKLGLQVQIDQLEAAAPTAKYLQAHDFDAVIGGGLGFTIDPDQTRFWSAKEYPSGANFVHYVNPAVDKLLGEARTVPGCDPTARKALYQQFQQLVAEDQPWTFSLQRQEPGHHQQARAKRGAQPLGRRGSVHDVGHQRLDSCALMPGASRPAELGIVMGGVKDDVQLSHDPVGNGGRASIGVTTWGIGETLTRVSRHGKVVPWLAEGFRNVDPLTWQVLLRRNARFWDGTPVTADAVAACVAQNCEEQTDLGCAARSGYARTSCGQRHGRIQD